MSSSTSVLPTPVTGSPEVVQAELRAEAMVVERLRQQIQAKGSAATKEEMAEYAKRQKAYLDRKIDFEKHRKTVIDLPTPSLVPPKKAEGAAKAPEVEAKAPVPAPEAKAPVVEPAKEAAPAPVAEVKPVVEPPAAEKPVEKTISLKPRSEAPAPPTAPAKKVPLKPAASKPPATASTAPATAAPPAKKSTPFTAPVPAQPEKSASKQMLWVIVAGAVALAAVLAWVFLK